MKKIIIFLSIVFTLMAVFVMSNYEPTITGAVVANPGIISNEKVIYLEQVKDIVGETTVILNNVNDYTILAVSSEITPTLYQENVERDLSKIQEFKKEIDSMNIPDAYTKHHENLTKEYNYYESTLNQMLINIERINITPAEIRILSQ